MNNSEPSKSAFIVLTGDCNRDCSYCFNKNIDQQLLLEQLTTPQLTRLIGDLAQAGLQEIIFSGGEPTLYPDLVLAGVEATKSSGMRVALDTNGLALDSQLIDRLKALHLDNLYLSTHYLGQMDRNTLRYLQEHLSLHLIHILTRRNIAATGALIDDLQSNGIALPALNPIFLPKDHRDYYQLSLSSMNSSDLREQISGLKESFKKHGLHFPELLEQYYVGSRDRIPKNCHMGSHDLVIYPHGEAYPCFHRRDLPAGNIKEQPVGEVVERVRELAKETCRAQCFGEHCLTLFLN
jgi:MoaA/NifB/PqqE/SkfB family radical SAM enzyme